MSCVACGVCVCSRASVGEYVQIGPSSRHATTRRLGCYRFFFFVFLNFLVLDTAWLKHFVSILKPPHSQNNSQNEPDYTFAFFVLNYHHFLSAKVSFQNVQ
jgi:hypothetical protein